MKKTILSAIMCLGLCPAFRAQVTVTEQQQGNSSVRTTHSQTTERKTIPQVSDRSFSINNAYDDLQWTINRAKRDAEKHVGVDFFARYPVRADMSHFADESGSDAGLFTGSQAEAMDKTFLIGSEYYRLPTVEEMVGLVPLTGTEPPIIRFGQDVEVNQRIENVSFNGEEPVSTRADYWASAKDDAGAVVAIRFQDATNKHRTAFRYEIAGNSLIVRSKLLGANLSVTTPQDVAASGWWMRQADAETRRFPLRVVGQEKKKTLLAANYWTGTTQGAQRVALCITHETVTLTPIPGVDQAFALPVHDNQAANQTADFFGAMAYGNNLSLETDSTHFLVESYDIPEHGLVTTLKIYARSMNGTPRLQVRTKQDGNFVSVDALRKQSPIFRNFTESEPAEGAKLFEFVFSNNYSDSVRYAEIKVDDASNLAGHSKTFYVRQLNVGLPLFEGKQVPMEYLSDYPLTPEGQVGEDEDDDIGFYNFSQAKKKACVAVKTNPDDTLTNIYKYYHLPTLLEMACILPNKELTFAGGNERISMPERFSFANYQPEATWDCYYQRKNGRIYAQRYGKDQWRHAARYEWIDEYLESGLQVTIVYNDMDGKRFYQELTNDELFDGDSPTYKIFFPATGLPDGTRRGEVGWIWCVSDDGEPMAYTFDSRHIAPVRMSENDLCAVMPFEGKVDFDYMTLERLQQLQEERLQKEKEAAQRAAKVAATKPAAPAPRPVKAAKKPGKVRRDKGNRRNPSAATPKPAPRRVPYMPSF